MDTITPENVRDLFTYDPISGELRWKHSNGSGIYAGDLIKSKDSDGYSNLSYKSKKYKAHRVAWLYHYGKWPIANIDHKDGERLNNKINNLREATVTENNQNQECHRLGKYPGIKLTVRNTYTVKKSLQGKVIWIGTFDTLEEAIAAWKASIDIESALRVKEEAYRASGSSFRHGSWPCCIEIQDKGFHLGSFKTKEERDSVFKYAKKMKRILKDSGIDTSTITKDQLLLPEIADL